MRPRGNSPLLYLLVCGLILGLFAIDILLPLGVGGGAPYVAVVLAAAWSPKPRFPLFVAGICSVLTVAGIFLSPSGAEILAVAVNRILALFAIWATGLLAWFRCRVETRRLVEHRLLEAAYEDLDSFARTLSHDLRSLLTPIIAYANMVREEFGECLGASGHNALTEIENQGNRMLALMEDLLVLCRIGHLPSPEAPISANEVVQTVMRHLEGHEGLEIRVAPLPYLRVAPTLVEQIFFNLIVNAIRYAGKAGGPIEVMGEREGDVVTFCVRDHGPGVPPSEREKIFDVFYRGSTARALSGTGVGLATVKRIARLFGGTAWVEETPGGGATFKVAMRWV